jgi:hypothetical protein
MNINFRKMSYSEGSIHNENFEEDISNNYKLKKNEKIEKNKIYETTNNVIKSKNKFEFTEPDIKKYNFKFCSNIFTKKKFNCELSNKMVLDSNLDSKLVSELDSKPNSRLNLESELELTILCESDTQKTIKTSISKTNNFCLLIKNKFIPSHNTLINCLKKIFMFMFHLSLISIFEIIFFFTIVSVYENDAIIKIIINFFKDIPTICNQLDIQQKINFTNIFNSLVNVTEIDNNANKSYAERIHFNNKLYINAWMYFLAIISIDLILLFVKCYYKIKINFNKIIFDNILMISILAIYEYIFFKSIILFYQNISKQELIKSIVQQFTSCLTE